MIGKVWFELRKKYEEESGITGILFGAFRDLSIGAVVLLLACVVRVFFYRA